MSDNALIKEFKSRDIQRLRNLVSKDFQAKSGVQIGYTKAQEDHQEGDIWEEDGRKWTIKNGIKQTINKLDAIKKLVVMPLTCPNCSKPMIKGRVDKYMYTIHRKCFDCVIEYETKLKAEGKFEEYQRNIKKQSINIHIKELENLIFELSMTTSEESFVTEAGDVETWNVNETHKNQLIEGIKEYIQKLKDMDIS